MYLVATLLPSRECCDKHFKTFACYDLPNSRTPVYPTNHCRDTSKFCMSCGQFSSSLDHHDLYILTGFNEISTSEVRPVSTHYVRRHYFAAPVLANWNAACHTSPCDEEDVAPVAATFWWSQTTFRPASWSVITVLVQRGLKWTESWLLTEWRCPQTDDDDTLCPYSPRSANVYLVLPVMIVVVSLKTTYPAYFTIWGKPVN